MSKTNQEGGPCHGFGLSLQLWEVPGGPYEDDDYDARDVARDCLKQGDLQGGWQAGLAAIWKAVFIILSP